MEKIIRRELLLLAKHNHFVVYFAMNMKMNINLRLTTFNLNKIYVLRIRNNIQLYLWIKRFFRRSIDLKEL